MLLILFGLAGAGKTYVGELIQKHMGFYFWDADSLLSPDMITCVESGDLFTAAMLDNYFERVKEQIQVQRVKHQRLAIAQAFYKNSIREELGRLHQDAHFLQITAEPEVLAHQLRKRNNYVTEAYAAKILPYYEQPSHPHINIYNSGDGEALILEQLRTKIPALQKTRLG